MIKYKQSDTGFTESNINLILDNEFSEIDVNYFIKNYKISKVFYGKFFIKRLIKKIFKYKLTNSFVWNKNFWDNIQIIKVNAKVLLKKKINSSEEFKEILNKNYSNKRLINIYKYKKLILKGESLGQPLYITGSCLNILGANINKNEIFMLDGSRRLCAHLIAEVNDINIILIKLNFE